MSGPKENERKQTPDPTEIIPNTPPPKPRTDYEEGDDELPPTAPQEAPRPKKKSSGDRRSIPPREEPPLVISRTRGADQHGHWGITSMVNTVYR